MAPPKPPLRGVWLWAGEIVAAFGGALVSYGLLALLVLGRPGQAAVALALAALAIALVLALRRWR